MSDARSTTAPQFDDPEQQAEAAHLGMWLFLATEVLFFGGLFVAYTVYRCTYPQAFAEASRELSLWCGAGDTAILLMSSFVMALAVHAAKMGSRRGLAGLLLGAAAFGVLFLSLHSYEYWRDITGGHFPGRAFQRGPMAETEMFYVLYFIMTGLHSLHVIIGVIALGTMAVFAWRGRFSTAYVTPVEVTGLYWHFVDVVWVFLFPLFYLIAHRQL